jgi:hypothetical protein
MNEYMLKPLESILDKWQNAICGRSDSGSVVVKVLCVISVSDAFPN